MCNIRPSLQPRSTVWYGGKTQTEKSDGFGCPIPLLVSCYVTLNKCLIFAEPQISPSKMVDNNITPSWATVRIKLQCICEVHNTMPDRSQCSKNSNYCCKTYRT